MIRPILVSCLATALPALLLGGPAMGQPAPGDRDFDITNFNPYNLTIACGVHDLQPPGCTDTPADPVGFAPAAYGRQDAVGTSNGVGWSVADTGFIISAFPALGGSSTNGSTYFDNGAYFDPPTGKDAMHAGGANMAIVFNQCVGDVVFYVRENGGSAAFTFVDVSMAPTWVSGQPGISGNSVVPSVNGGAVRLSNVNADIIFLQRGPFFDGMTIAWYVESLALCDDDDDDGDGVLNGVDNCPGVPNDDQTDLDTDGLGDACDDDADGDGLLNVDDNCPYDDNPGQSDLDQDGIGDVCDDTFDAVNLVDDVDTLTSIAADAIVASGVSGGPGLIAKLEGAGNGSVEALVVGAIADHDAGTISTAGYIAKLLQALDKLDQFDAQLAGKIGPGQNQLTAQEAAPIQAISADLRDLIQLLFGVLHRRRGTTASVGGVVRPPTLGRGCF